MTFPLSAFLWTYGPTLVICSLFHLWSRATQIPWLKRLLYVSSTVGAIYFLVLLIVVYGALSICDGGLFEGVENCSLLPDFLASLFISLAFMSYALAILYALILVSAGGLVEALRPTPRN